MSSRQSPWASAPSAPGPSGRRNTISPESPPAGFPFDYPQRPLHRSASATSPSSPPENRLTGFYDEISHSTTNLGHPARDSNDQRAHTETLSQYAHYMAEYAAATAPRSAPSTTTFFNNQDVDFAQHSSSANGSWPVPTTSSPQSRASQLYYGFTPINSNPYDSWTYRGSRQPQDHTYTSSPTSYANFSEAQSFNDALQQGRGFSTPSTPSQAQPYAQQSSYGESQPTETARRESEGVDAFTSATDFALFVEATSSLSISPMPSPGLSQHAWQGGPRTGHRAYISTERLDAPLPPLPVQSHTQLRSQSSPASASRRNTPPAHPNYAQSMYDAPIIGFEYPDFIDDELPNYEQSQAEVTLQQRREAARRAQELNDAWHRSERRGR